MKQLVSPRWIAGHLLALSLVILFVNAGFWQLRRLESRRDYNALLSARLESPPRPLAELRALYGSPKTEDEPLAYRRTRVRGHFDTANEVLLRSRSYRSQPGYHVLTPLRLSAEESILVDRGWVPFEMDRPPIVKAAPPAGEIELTGILFPSQTASDAWLSPKDPPEGPLDALFWLDTERLSAQMPYALLPVYLELGEQVPGQPGPLPVPPAPPELSEGPHLGYAVQWFAFALIGVVGYAILLRRTVLETRAAS